METLDETASVTSAAKVTGTHVYNTAGDPLGEIHDVYYKTAPYWGI